MKKAIISLFSLLILMFTSCSVKKPTIEMVYSFPNESWNAFNEIELSTPLSDKENPYQIVLEVELSDNFEPKEFSFGLTQSNDDGESRYSYHTFPVRDAKLNMINKKAGEYYIYRLIINKKTYFNSVGKYTWTLESVMGKVKVKGVHKLSIELIQQ